MKLTIPSLFVIIGWAVTYYLQQKNAAKQETRKDARVRLDRLEAMLTDLRQGCTAYYTDSAKGAESEWAILGAIDDLRISVNVLMPVVIDGSKRVEVVQKVSAIAQHATGGPFQTKNRQPLESDDKQLRQLNLAMCRLVEQLEGAFAKRYPLK